MLILWAYYRARCPRMIGSVWRRPVSWRFSGCYRGLQVRMLDPFCRPGPRPRAYRLHITNIHRILLTYASSYTSATLCLTRASVYICVFVCAVGGQLVGTMVYVDHHAPVGHKGYYGGITLAGGALGVLLGSLEGALIVAVCTPQQVP